MKIFFNTETDTDTYAWRFCRFSQTVISSKSVEITYQKCYFLNKQKA